MNQKKNAIKLLSWTLAVGLIVSACSGGGEKIATDTKSGAGAPGQGDNRYAKQMKLTMFHSGAYNPAVPMPAREEDPIRQMLEKKVNIDLQMIIPPLDQKAAKLNSLIASGEIPDLIYMASRLDAVQYYNQGIAQDLDEQLKNYPELQKRFSQAQWEAVKYKGKTIGIPGNDLVNGIQGWWIRNDWLKKLNLKAPTTPDELLEVMKAFTLKDPDGNGKDDTYGFIGGVGKDGSLVNQGWEPIFLMFGVAPNGVRYEGEKLLFDNEDGKMKEALTFINKMREAKVIDPDWVSTNDGAARATKQFKGKVGIVINDWRNMEPDIQTKMKEVGGEVPDWTVIAPPKGPYGDQLVGFESFQANSWLISKAAAKDPEKLTRILDFVNYWYTDKELYPYVAYGLKGIHWDLADGKVKRLTPSPDDINKYRWVTNYFQPRKGDDALYFNFQNPQTAEFHKINIKYMKPNKVAPYIVADPSDTLYSDRQKYMNEMTLKFMNGKEPLSNWDSYLETLNNKFQHEKFKQLSTKQLQELGIVK